MSGRMLFLEEDEKFAVGSSKIAGAVKNEMKNELPQATAATSNLSREQPLLAEELSKVKNELVKPKEERVNEPSRGITFGRSQSELKRPRLHGPGSINHSSVVSKGVGEKSSSVPEEDYEPADDSQIVIEVKEYPASKGKSTWFRIRRNTMLEKLMSVYSHREGKDFDAFCYLYNGRRIRKEQTPYELGMKGGERIDAMPTSRGPCLTCIAHFNNEK